MKPGGSSVAAAVRTGVWTDPSGEPERSCFAAEGAQSRTGELAGRPSAAVGALPCHRAAPLGSGAGGGASCPLGCPLGAMVGAPFGATAPGAIISPPSTPIPQPPTASVPSNAVPGDRNGAQE